MSKIRFKIPKNNVVEVEGVDCTGGVCKVLSAPIEAALGTIVDSQEKPEFFVELDGVKQEVNES